MKIASIDIGTNTILMLIAEYDPGNNSIKPIRNFIKIPRIGDKVAATREISPEKTKELIRIISDYACEARAENCGVILASGTNALRLAENSPDIIKEVFSVTGVNISIISPSDEALFSYLGAIGENNGKSKTVIDIGGGSTEIICGTGVNIEAVQSFQLGVVVLKEKFFSKFPATDSHLLSARAFIGEVISPFLSKIKKTDEYIAIAGTPTTLASIKAGISDLDEDKIHNSVLTVSDLEDFINLFSTLTPAEIGNKFNISKGREDVILGGTIILSEILKRLGTDSVKVSAHGLRYGAIKYYFTMNAGKYFG